MMPPDDKTPSGYMLPTPSPVERWVKVRLRHVLYPHYLRLYPKTARLSKMWEQAN